MYKLYILTLVTIFTVFLSCTDSILAVSENVLIATVQTRSISGGSAYDEYVELYNNSYIDVDISGWCLKYGTSGSFEPTKTLGCFEHDENSYIILPAKSYVLFVSANLSGQGVLSDYTFSSGLSDADRWLAIFDDQNSIIDLVEWGVQPSSLTAEGGSQTSRSSSQNIITRNSTGNLYVDTDDNANDFSLSLTPTAMTYGYLYEVTDLCSNIDGLQIDIPNGYYADNDSCKEQLVDYCKNIDGIQESLLSGYMYDEYGDCYEDVCPNINDLQIFVPNDMRKSEAGSCDYVDFCPNIDGNLVLLPEDYYLDQTGCFWDFDKLLLSEIMPNVDGTDEGNEYIEIYNPNSFDVDLSLYRLLVKSKTSEKLYEMPNDAVIKPNSYFTIDNTQIKYSLNNTYGTVEILTHDGQSVDVSEDYSDPKEDEAWQYINETWAYSNRPTPNSENLAYYVTVEIVQSKTIQYAPCEEGEYRNPETNRCNKIEVSTSTQVPCKVGQYRSEETGRCRNIVSDVVSYVPCSEGEERNPETNRCRKITAELTSSSLAPCPDGQERNPETNRCRKVTDQVLSAVGFAPSVSQSQDNGWYIVSITGLIVIAVIYGIWEWRQEIINGYKKVTNIFSKK